MRVRGGLADESHPSRFGEMKQKSSPSTTLTGDGGIGREHWQQHRGEHVANPNRPNHANMIPIKGPCNYYSFKKAHGAIVLALLWIACAFW